MVEINKNIMFLFMSTTVTGKVSAGDLRPPPTSCDDRKRSLENRVSMAPPTAEGRSW